jgi:hypothetical protein
VAARENASRLMAAGEIDRDDCEDRERRRLAAIAGWPRGITGRARNPAGGLLKARFGSDTETVEDRPGTEIGTRRWKPCWTSVVSRTSNALRFRLASRHSHARGQCAVRYPIICHPNGSCIRRLGLAQLADMSLLTRLMQLRSDGHPPITFGTNLQAAEDMRPA